MFFINTSYKLNTGVDAEACVVERWTARLRLRCEISGLPSGWFRWFHDVTANGNTGSPWSPSKVRHLFNSGIKIIISVFLLTFNLPLTHKLTFIFWLSWIALLISAIMLISDRPSLKVGGAHDMWHLHCCYRSDNTQFNRVNTHCNNTLQFD